MKTYHVLICPYCDRVLSEDSNYCCGEAGHGEWAYVNADGERLVESNEDNLESEVDSVTKEDYSIMDESLWGYDI